VRIYQIRVTRDLFGPDWTLSRVDIAYGDEQFAFFGYCCEDVDRRVEEDSALKVKGKTAIPIGRYKLRLYDSPKHGPKTPELIDVPGFQHIQIHSGNSQLDTEGCLLFGMQRDAATGRVIRSGVACKWIRDRVIEWIAAGHTVTVEICRE